MGKLLEPNLDQWNGNETVKQKHCFHATDTDTDKSVVKLEDLIKEKVCNLTTEIHDNTRANELRHSLKPWDKAQKTPKCDVIPIGQHAYRQVINSDSSKTEVPIVAIEWVTDLDKFKADRAENFRLMAEYRKNNSTPSNKQSPPIKATVITSNIKKWTWAPKNSDQAISESIKKGNISQLVNTSTWKRNKKTTWKVINDWLDPISWNLKWIYSQIKKCGFPTYYKEYETSIDNFLGAIERDNYRYAINHIEWVPQNSDKESCEFTLYLNSLISIINEKMGKEA